MSNCICQKNEKKGMPFTLLVTCLVAFAATQVDAAVLFSENFNSIPTTRILSSLPGWNMVNPTFGVSTNLGSTSALHGTTDLILADSRRGAMFREATGVNEVRFRFLRAANHFPVNDGDSLQVGITESQSIHPLYSSLDGTGNRVAFSFDTRDNGAESLNFAVWSGNQVLYVWDLRDMIDDGWYDAFIRLDTNNTVGFGYKPIDEQEYILSSGHSLPPSFQNNFVGVTAFRVDDRYHIDYGEAVVDDIVALSSLGFEGDLNNDGFVDAADYVTWRKGFNTTYAQVDYDLWRENFGNGGPAAATIGVPEPSTILLIGFGAISLLGYRKAKSHG